MIVMIFEYQFDPDATDVYEEYLAKSAEVRTHLSGIEGFHSVERFASPDQPGKFVAIGYFEDEAAVEEWRNLPEHREAQELGRQRFFTDYRLCMAEVTRDYSKHDREAVPDDSRSIHG